MLGRHKLTAEPIVPEPSTFEVEMTIEKLKRCKSPGIDQIPAELIKAGGGTIRSDVHKLLIRFEIRKNCLRSGRSRSFYLFIRRATKQTVVIIQIYQFCNYIQNFIQHPTDKVSSICTGNYWVSSMWILT
jgi:hypothetical protein